MGRFRHVDARSLVVRRFDCRFVDGASESRYEHQTSCRAAGEMNDRSGCWDSKKGLKRKEGRVFKHGSISMEW